MRISEVKLFSFFDLFFAEQLQKEQYKDEQKPSLSVLRKRTSWAEREWYSTWDSGSSLHHEAGSLGHTPQQLDQKEQQR